MAKRKNTDSVASQTPSSPFNPQTQVHNAESTTIAALERLSEAFRVLLWWTGKEHKLSPIAVQILTFLRFHTPEQCTVGYLATEFNMTKQTVSEAVVTLESRGFVEKKASLKDARSQTLVLTQEGRKLAESVSTFTAPLEESLLRLGETERVSLVNGLLSLVRILNESGIVQTQRMCYTCRFYAVHHAGNDQYCLLLGQALHAYGTIGAEHTIRIDCDDHETRNSTAT